MDARTYAWAAHIAKEKGDKRAYKFQMAAVDAWNKKYGIEEYNHDKIVFHGRKMEFIPNPSTNYSYQPDQYGVTEWYKNMGQHYNGQTVIWFNPMCYKNGFYGETQTSWGMIFSLDTKELKNLLSKKEGYRVAKEMNDLSGKYIPGKGWK